MKKIILIISGILLTLSSLASCVNTPKVEEEKTFKVTWKNEDGSILEVDFNVKEGELPSFDGETPSKDNDEYYSYSFKGWNKELEPVYSDITYIAQYEKIELVYTVTWENYDGTILEVDENVKKGSIPEYNGKIPIRESDFYEYTFIGWDSSLNPITKDTIFKAQYSQTEASYSIKYVDYDGTIIKEYNDINYGEHALYYGDLPSRKSDSKYHYNFVGWSPNVTEVRENKIYEALYEAIPLSEYKPYNKDNYLSRIPTKDNGQIFLYGEFHDDYLILQAQLEAWDLYYKKYGMRDFFIERNSIFASQLNTYISGKNEKLLDGLYNRGALGTVGKDFVYNFYKTFKDKYPETVFHGVDSVSGGIGNQDPNDYIDTLIDRNEINPEIKGIALEDLSNNEIYRTLNDEESAEFRESKMAERFVEELERIDYANCMGAFGTNHTYTHMLNLYGQPFLGNRLYHIFGENVYYEDLSDTVYGGTKLIKMKIGSKTYDVYDGHKRYLSSFSELGDYDAWHIYFIANNDDCFDFINYPLTGVKIDRSRLPVNQAYDYQIYIIDFYKNEEFKIRKYYRSDSDHSLIAHEFII